MDKKTCKIKRDIALLLLKANKYDEALEEVLSVEEQEKTLYGENSIQLGRTYKLIGTLYILRRKPTDARVYLQKAQRIFEAKGSSKLVKEVRHKLQMLSNSMKLDEENLEGREEDIESDPDFNFNSEVKPEKTLKKGKTAKKGKKKVVRNNFID